MHLPSVNGCGTLFPSESWAAPCEPSDLTLPRLTAPELREARQTQESLWQEEADHCSGSQGKRVCSKGASSQLAAKDFFWKVNLGNLPDKRLKEILWLLQDPFLSWEDNYDQ